MSLFYCNAYNSTQKASVENMKKQLRLHFPKGQSIQHHTQNLTRINQHLISLKLESLNRQSPQQAFIAVYGVERFNQLFQK